MKFDAQSVVAIVAVVASFLTTWINLRSNRLRARDERLWSRNADIYEDFIGYCVQGMKERHEWATGVRQGPFEVDPAEPDEFMPTLDRMLIYASAPVASAVEHLGKAERDWRQAYAHWLVVGEDPDHPDEPEALRKVRAASEVADAVAMLVVTVVKQELTTGTPPTPRWIKRLRYRSRADAAGAAGAVRRADPQGHGVGGSEVPVSVPDGDVK